MKAPPTSSNGSTRARLALAIRRLWIRQPSAPEVGLARLARRLEDSLDPHGVPATLAVVIAQALQARSVAVYLKPMDAEDLVLAAEHPGNGDGVEVTKNPAEIGEPAADPSAAPSARPLTFPLLHESEVVGQLVVLPFSRRPPTTEELELLAMIARRAGSAAQVVRQAHDLLRARERLVLAREEERRRLRRNLHDTIGPTLAALSLKAGAVRSLMEHDTAAAQQQFNELREQIQSVITDIRRVVYDLRPPALDELGMIPAIREQARQFSTGGLQVSVDAPDQMPPLPAAVEVAAYRIVMEALTNVARHARARQCLIRLAVNDQLSIEVVDDGVGLTAKLRAGVGIASMRERVAELGGSCTIESAPGGGTRVLAFLPATSRAPGWDGDTTGAEPTLRIEGHG